MTWLITVARNLSIDRLRKRQKGPLGGLDMSLIADDRPSPEAAAIASSERRKIDACMDELEDNKASAVRAAYLDGATYKELAQEHDVPLNTMRTWLRRSLMKLKDCMSK